MSPQEQNGNRFGASTAASSHSKTKAPAVYPEHRCTPGVRARQQPLISLNESARYAAISRGTYEHLGEKAEDYRQAYRALRVQLTTSASILHAAANRRWSKAIEAPARERRRVGVNDCEHTPQIGRARPWRA